MMNTVAIRENTGAVLHPDYKNEVLEIVRSNLTPKLMAEKLSGYHENDIAEAMELMSRDERKRLYSILSSEALSGILEYSDRLKDYMAELGIKKKLELLSRFDSSVAVDYLRELSKEERNNLLELMDGELRREIMLLSSFDEDEIGSRMSTNFVSIRSGLSIRQAMRSLVEQAAENDNISTVYVVDTDGALAGAIELKDLIIAREGTELSAITKSSYPYVYAEEQIEDCIERLRDYSEDSIPVLDGDNKLRGVLTSQDITKLVDEELGEDYARLAGLSAEEDLREPLKKSMGKRLPWLIILLGLGLVVSSVVGAFESVVAQLTLIISFQSLILDMAGNVGTQSLAVTIRVLMDEQLSGREKALLVLKEGRVGLANGFVLGLLSFVFIGLYLLVLKGQPGALAFSLSACTGIALTLSILLSSITGTLVPLAFKKLKVDPAVASGPLITTLNDLVAVVTYYGLAWLLLIKALGI